jgi:methyl acetate hydrolase
MAVRVTDNAGQFMANYGKCGSLASPHRWQRSRDRDQHGSLAWAGLGNTYFWIDPARDVTGVILMQVLPFVDSKCLEAYAGFERGVYAGLGAGSGQKAA